MSELNEKIRENEIVIFTSKDEDVSLAVKIENETVWLTQAQMTELFGVDRTVITRHINNVFKEGELKRESNVQILHIANSDRPVKFYNLDVIISVGYRVKSKRGVEFRKWSNSVLKLEEKAAHLLYFVTKNHSIFDGNKRIAAAMFLYFLDKNGALFEMAANGLMITRWWH